MGITDRAIPRGAYPRADGSEIDTFRPGNTQYNAATGLLLANPFLMQREGAEFETRWAGFKERATTLAGWGETLKLSIGMNVGMKLAMPAILLGLTRRPVWSLLGRVGLGSAGAVRGLSTVILSGLISGGLTLYQRGDDPRMAQESFLLQWGRSFVYALPSSLLAMHAMHRWGFGATLLQETMMEGAQAGLSVGVGYGLELCGGMPASTMTVGQRLKIEFCEGALFMASGRGVGGGLDRIHRRISSTMPQLPARLDHQLEPETAAASPAVPELWPGRGPLAACAMMVEAPRRRGKIAGGAAPGVKPTAFIFLGPNGVLGTVTPEGRWEPGLERVELDLPPGATELSNPFVRVTGTEPWDPKASYLPSPQMGGHFFTDPLQQVHGFHYAAAIGARYRALGFDLEGIVGAGHRRQAHPFPIGVNDKSVGVNAFYRPGPDEELRFGPFVVMDQAVVEHEMGHGMMDHLNPVFLLNSQLRLGEEDMFADGHLGSEGGGIHEGTGDGFATIAGNDPRMARYLMRMIDPANDEGLRNVNHQLKLSDVGEEVHEKGQVYGGFWWSLCQRVLNSEGMTIDAARDLLLRLIPTHIACCSTQRPTPGHFVEAVERAARRLEIAGMLPDGLSFGEVQRMIRQEGAARELLAEGASPQGPRLFQDLGRAANRDIHEAMRRYAEKYPQLKFVHVAKVPIPGGAVSYWKQMYPVATVTGETAPVPVEVVGHGMVQWYGPDGRAIEVARGDVRRIKPGEINQSVDIPFAKALSTARKRLLQMIMEIEGGGAARAGRIVGKQPGAPRSREDELKLEQYRLMSVALTGEEASYPRKLAILGGSKILFWEINLGFAIFYIPAEQAAFARRPDGYFQSRVLSDCWRLPHQCRNPAG